MHKHSNYGGSQKKKRKRKCLRKCLEIIDENFPNMEKVIANQVQEAQRVPYRINPKRNMPKHILIKQRLNTRKEY